jgi:SAM-dependent methyltransferase
MASEADAADHTDRVRRYYDTNTARFVRRGQGGAALHRAVWGPGVTTRSAAFRYVDDVVLQHLPTNPPIPMTPTVRTPTPTERPLVIDLGCGLGASLIHLAQRTDLVGEGLTISGIQASRAAEVIAAAGLSDRLRCRAGNYLDPPADLAGADLAFSIESFVHGPDPARYFRCAAGMLRPGGRLVVCDDFRQIAPGHSPDGDACVEEFRRGWRVGSLITVDHARDLARDAGLVLLDDVDLTPWLELRRLRDRWTGLAVALARPLRLDGEYWRALAGGNALQAALRLGMLAYRLLAFERR